MNKQNFLNKLHKLWMATADFLEYDEYLDLQWALMLRYGVNWKLPADLDLENYVRSVAMCKSVEELFEMEANSLASDKFPVFAATCETYMNLDKLQLQKAA